LSAVARLSCFIARVAPLVAQLARVVARPTSLIAREYLPIAQLPPPVARLSPEKPHLPLHPNLPSRKITSNPIFCLKQKISLPFHQKEGFLHTQKTNPPSLVSALYLVKLSCLVLLSAVARLSCFIARVAPLVAQLARVVARPTSLIAREYLPIAQLPPPVARLSPEKPHLPLHPNLPSRKITSNPIFCLKQKISLPFHQKEGFLHTQKTNPPSSLQSPSSIRLNPSFIFLLIFHIACFHQSCCNVPRLNP